MDPTKYDNSRTDSVFVGVGKKSKEIASTV